PAAFAGTPGVVEPVQPGGVRLAFSLQRDARPAGGHQASAVRQAAARFAGGAQSRASGAPAGSGVARPWSDAAGRGLLVRAALEGIAGLAGARHRERPPGAAHPARQGREGTLRAALAAVAGGIACLLAGVPAGDLVVSWPEAIAATD